MRPGYGSVRRISCCRASLSTVSSPARLRQALRADFPLIVDIWTAAFDGDPFLSWMCGDGEWSRFGPEWLGFILDLTFERGHTYVADGDAAAVGWIPPDLPFAGPGDMDRGRAIIERHAGADRADSALQTILSMRAHITDDPHWTLQYIGVRSSHRGKGLGATMVAPQLAGCDRDQLPCSLISSNPVNVPFYRRLGFAIDAEIWSPDGAASVRAMSRQPDQGL
jgi:ribosomal protein S18 acetylase RimI-like enzyme